MARLTMPPKPEYANRHTWRVFCNFPTLNWTNGDRCGKQVTGWSREPIDGPPPYPGFRYLMPGPWLEHLPCGHIWSLVTREWIRR